MIISSSSIDHDESNCALPRSELDSHANMVVLGAHAFVFDSIYDNTCDVLPFDPSIGTSRSVPIIDGAIAYDCQRTNETYLLIFKNALYVPTLDHNLLTGHKRYIDLLTDLVLLENLTL